MSGGLAKTEYSADNGLTWTTGTGVTYLGWRRGGGSGTYSLLVRSTDAAGNTETPHEVTVKIDTTRPTCSDDAPITPVAGPYTVHFTGHDRYSPIAETWYSLDGGDWTKAASVEVSGAGDHTIRYYAVDAAGNYQVGYRVCLLTLTEGDSPSSSSSMATRRSVTHLWPKLSAGRYTPLPRR